MTIRLSADTLTKTVEETDTQFGFIWGTIEDEYFLRTPDRQYKGVSRHVVETLRDEAPETPIDELIAQVEEQRSAAADILREMHEEGYIREDAPIERMVPPDDIELWPRLLASALLVLVVGAVWAYTITLLPGPAFDDPLGYAVEAAVMTAVVLAIALVVHEQGHYHTAARQGVEGTVSVSVVNGIVPAVITRTNDSWALPRNRRIWISLAGPMYGVAWTLAVFGIYYTVWPHPAVAIAGLLCFGNQLAPLFPIYHGDGYFIVSDVLGERNIRTRGLEHLKSARLSWSAAYVAVSYGLIIGLFVANLLIAFFVADWWGVAIMVMMLFVSFLIRAWHRLPDQWRRPV